jgi:hypothetical protein
MRISSAADGKVRREIDLSISIKYLKRAFI